MRWFTAISLMLHGAPHGCVSNSPPLLQYAHGAMTRRSLCFLLILFLAAAVSCINSKGYLERGNKFFEQGKFDDASINYRKAIQKDPQFVEAFYRLSQSEVRRQKFGEAFQALLRATELAPDNLDYKVSLADLSLQLYQADTRRPRILYDQLQKTTSQLEAKAPSGFDALRLRGFIHLIDRQVKPGIEKLERAQQAKPFEPTVVFALAQALYQDGRGPEAQKLALALIEKKKEFGPIYDLLYQIYIAGKQTEEAEKIIAAKVANNPKEPEFLLQQAVHYARAQKPEAMRATVQRLLDNTADFPIGYLQAGNFYASLGNFDESLRLFEEGAKRNPKDRISYWKRTTAVLLAQDKKQDAARMVETILKEVPKDGESLRMRAALLLDTRKPENIEKAVTEFQALVEEKPDDVVTRFNLGRALVAKGNQDEARKELLEALRQNRSFLPARLMVAEIALPKRDFKEVLSQTNELLAVQPVHPRGRLLRAAANTGLGNYVEARAELSKLIKDQPKYTDAQLQLATVDLAEKKFKDAEDGYRKLYQPGQADMRALEGLVTVLMARNQPEQASRLLNDDLKKSVRPAAVRILLARVAIATQRFDEGIGHIQELLKERPDAPDLLRMLGEVYLRKGDLTQAVAILEKTHTLAPKDATALLMLGNAQEQAGRTQEAMASYRRLLELQADNPAAMNNLAFLLAETGDNLDEALKLSQRALERIRDHPAFSDTLGWVYLKKNMPDSALQIFTMLVAKDPGNAGFQYHLGMTYLAKGDKAKARAAFITALSKKPPKDMEEQIQAALSKLG